MFDQFTVLEPTILDFVLDLLGILFSDFILSCFLSLFLASFFLFLVKEHCNEKSN